MYLSSLTKEQLLVLAEAGIIDMDKVEIYDDDYDEESSDG